MLWKVYFWVYLLFTLFVVLTSLSSITVWNGADWIDITSTILLLNALFRYSYTKQSINTHHLIMTVIFAAGSFTLAALTALIQNPPFLPSFLLSRSVTDPQELARAILFQVPALISLILLSSRRFYASKAVEAPTKKKTKKSKKS